MPLDYDPASDSFLFAEVDLDVLGRAAFLDRRLGDAWERTIAVPATEVRPPFAAATPSAWLFHTAFCGSTLLARALHAPPHCVALKEPVPLYALALTTLHERSAQDTARTDERLLQTMALLARPWVEGGRVLVKPTNGANRLLPHILARCPDARVVLLYSGLDDFLVSCLKKLPQAETLMRWMAEQLVPGTDLPRRLGIPDGHRFNFVESCVLTWYAQIERYAEALDGDAADRIRSLDMQAMLDAQQRATDAAAAWLGLDAAREGIEARVADVFARDAKSPERAHGRARRDAEAAEVKERHGKLVARALDWARDSVAPGARLPVDWKPLAIAASVEGSNAGRL